MADSVGSGFPTSGINKGHLFYDQDEQSLWEYLGGPPTVDSSWKLLAGRFPTDPNTVTWGAAQAGAQWFNVGLGVPRYWDGTTAQTIGSGGGYSTVEVNHISLPQRSILNLRGRNVSGQDVGGTDTDIVLFDADVKMFEWDDFLSGSYTLFFAGTGKLGWFLNGAGTGGADNFTESGHPGIVNLFTGAGAGSTIYMYTPQSASNTGFVVFQDNWDVLTIVKLDNVDANTEFQFGLGGTIVTFGPSCRFEKLYGDTDVFAVTDSGIGSTRQSVLTPVAGEWYQFRIRKSGTDVVFSIDGVDVATINTTLPGGTIGLAMQYGLTNNAAANKQLLVDYCDMLLTGLSR
jgi:hypothetical protein